MTDQIQREITRLTRLGYKYEEARHKALMSNLPALLKPQAF